VFVVGVGALFGANPDIAYMEYVVRDCRMWREVAACVRGSRVSGIFSVRVGYCVSQVDVDVECGDDIVRAYRGANEDVAIECSVQ